MPTPRYVELVRVSSAGQSERDSPADQRKALDALRRSRPGTLVERIELGASGLSGALPLAKRPDLTRLRQLAEGPGFDELRVRHFDRWIRLDDPDEQEAAFSILRRARAVLVEADGAVTDPRSLPGRIVAIVKAEGAAEERRKIVERTVAGRRRLSAEGRPMTTIPYGRRYDHAAGEWSTDPREMAVYRRIFREVLDGTSLHRLATRLNGEGITAPKGGSWEASSLRRMIRNSTAVGRMTSYGHPITCPPVVDEVTQRRAVAEMEKGRTRSGPTAKYPALLRKILACGVCGGPMHVAVGRPGLVWYRCAGAKRWSGVPAKCSAGTHHPVAEVDASFLSALRRAVQDPERLVQQATRNRPGVGQAREDLEGVARELERLDRREENLIRMRSQGEVPDVAWGRQRAEINRLRAAAEERQGALAAVVDAAERAQEMAHDARAAVEAIRSRMGKTTAAEWRALIERAWPRQEGVWIRIHPSGRIQTKGGALRLGKPGSDTSASPGIPITLSVASGKR